MKPRRIEESVIYRWGVLLTISAVIFSSYYFYDVFSGIKVKLQASLGFTNADYGLMLGFYSISNTFLVMAIIGGVILDKWGIRKTGILFSFFMMAGAILTFYGTSDIFRNNGLGYSFFNSFAPKYTPELKMMMLGRMFFGLGSETVIVISSKVMVKWFKGKEMALAFGVNLAIARIGQISALWISPNIVKHMIWTRAGLIGAMIVVAGFLFFFIYSYFDNKYDNQSIIKAVESDQEEEQFRFKDLLQLFVNKSFIYITLLCVLFYSAVFPFLQYAPDFIANKFGIDPEISSRITSIIPFGTVILTPVFGGFVDKRGRSATLMILGSVLLVLVYVSLAFTKITPYIPLFVLGIAFSLIPAAMWPGVAKIVKFSALGTAYGTMTTIQNYGLMLFPWIIGKVLDKTNPGITAENVQLGLASYNYHYVVIMLGGLGILGIFFAIFLKRESKGAGYGLEEPSNG
ncbi:MAG: MFS transporter [Bacteroidales bacterium]|nr:MFS transporter [Bacteroidales bacterium]